MIVYQRTHTFHVCPLLTHGIPSLTKMFRVTIVSYFSSHHLMYIEVPKPCELGV
jgi:hypothetical protein